MVRSIGFQSVVLDVCLREVILVASFALKYAFVEIFNLY